mmetsp:Transcript_23107/g.39262  ORF Transcript_23107/g.39262 Transcript_23107/m.39262 type:complete len:508 (-) Transcript_23107:113-1636(-)
MSFPPLDGKDMPPIIIKGSPDPVSAKASLDDIPCDISCKEQSKIQGTMRYIEGTEWKITKTMDDPVKKMDAKVERNAFRTDEYYSSTSFESSVPLSYFSFDRYDIFSPAVDYDKVKPTGSYLIDSQCVAQQLHRNRWEDAVNNQVKVDSYGSCAHNADVPAGMNLHKADDRIALMKQHRFNLAFEFGDAKDHITPVVWEAFVSGTLPVVIGASNVGMHFPLHSFVGKDNCQKWDDLGNVVKDVMEDKKKWESYHAWRTDPKAKAAFEERYNFTRTSPECRMCRWAYAKRYGHGWDHKRQALRHTSILRDFCVDAGKIAVKPFRESWHHKTGSSYEEIVSAESSSSCEESRTEAKIGTMIRVLEEHDNVFDMTLTGLKDLSNADKLVLRLELPVHNTDGAHFQDAHTLVATARGALASSVAIQDKSSKVTVLASWETELRSLSEGVVEVVVQTKHENMHHGEDEIRRIRIIIEDMVELYDKITEYYPTSFGKLMVQDFVDPLELFYVD